jgi:hypothetical protein
MVRADGIGKESHAMGRVLRLVTGRAVALDAAGAAVQWLD